MKAAQQLQALTHEQRHKLADLLFASDTRESGQEHAIVLLKKGKGKRVLLLAHPITGDISPYVKLLPGLPEDLTVYAAQAVDWPQGECSIEAMARRYIAQLPALDEDARLSLGGWSLGGTIAYEMAKQLVGTRLIDHLLLIDSAPPNVFRIESLISDRGLVQLALNIMDSNSVTDITQTTGTYEWDSIDALIASLQQTCGRLGTSRLLKFLDIAKTLKNNYNAIKAYRPTPKLDNVRALLLYAQSKSYEHVESSWLGLIEDNAMEVEGIKGDHFTIMEEPAVNICSSRISNFIS